MSDAAVRTHLSAVGGLPIPEVIERLSPGKFRTGEGRPVVGIDIDGTLGDYHRHFLWFAEQWLGTPMPSAEAVNPGMRLSEFMEVPHHIYRECKLAYRQGGLKRFMPVYPYAAELTRKIRETKTEVWLCTTRPYLRLDNIDPDTREWLRRNGIQYDAVIFGSVDDKEDKYDELVRQVGRDRIVAVVDDLPVLIGRAIDAGISKVYIRDQPYNAGCQVHSGRVRTLQSLWWDHLGKDIIGWKGWNG